MDVEDMWRKVVLPEESSIGDAAQVLNNIGIRIVLITDKKGVLVGTISDGDIRRGLLKGLNLKSPIASIIHYKAIVVNIEKNRSEVTKLMVENKIQQIPIVNENNQVIGLHLWDELISPVIRTNTMIIMAGGKGTRLHPQTEKCPKPLLLIAGKPILQHIIERAKAEGITNFILAIYYLGQMIEDYFGNGNKFGVKIEYIREEIPLGTAGALSLLTTPLSEAFLVTNGDVLTDIRYGGILDFHQAKQCKATMAIRPHDYQNPFGVVQINGFEITSYEEKPIFRNYINTGVYVLDPSCLKLLKRSQPCDMPALFEIMLKNTERVGAYPVHECWLDVGSPADYQEAEKLSSRRLETNCGEN